MRNDLPYLRRELEEANDETVVGPAALWDRKVAEFRALGESKEESAQHATEYVSRIYGPPTTKNPIGLSIIQWSIVRDLGHAVRRAEEVVKLVRTVRSGVADGTLVSKEDLSELDRQLRQALTYVGYVTRAVSRGRDELRKLG